jgi:hypothetical protein
MPTAVHLANADDVARRRRDREMLVVAALVIILSYSLQVLPDERVAVRGLSDYPLPETCLARSAFHCKCPGCGLTRSCILLSRGDLRSSLAAHRLGWLMAAVIVLQVPYRLVSLRCGGPSTSISFLSRVFGYSLIACLIANWLYDAIGFTQAF